MPRQPKGPPWVFSRRSRVRAGVSGADISERLPEKKIARGHLGTEFARDLESYFMNMKG